MLELDSQNQHDSSGGSSVRTLLEDVTNLQEVQKEVKGGEGSGKVTKLRQLFIQ